MSIINALQKFFGATEDQTNHEEVNARLDALEEKWSAQQSSGACANDDARQRLARGPQQSVGNAMDAILMERGAYASLREQERKQNELRRAATQRIGARGRKVDFEEHFNPSTGLLSDGNLGVNPATGLMMFNDMVDTGGNAYGVSTMDD